MRATFLLLKDLQLKLVDAFKNHPLRYRSDDEIYVIPPIHIGHLPPKKQNETEGDPPFISIWSLETEHNTKQETGEYLVKFLCCIYSKESETEVEAGYNDILNMVDMLVMTLSEHHYYDNNNYFIDETIKSTLGLQKELGIYDAGRQDHPFYGAVVTAKFHTFEPKKQNFLNLTR